MFYFYTNYWFSIKICIYFLAYLIYGQEIIPASFQSEFLIPVVQPILWLISSELQSTKVFLVPKSLVESSRRYVGCWDITHRNFSRSSILMCHPIFKTTPLRIPQLAAEWNLKCLSQSARHWFMTQQMASLPDRFCRHHLHLLKELGKLTSWKTQVNYTKRTTPVMICEFSNPPPYTTLVN